jgi:ATP/maltotriose-dependent transcriptional regulator MalT
LLKEAVALFREVDDKEFAAYSLFSLALLASSQGEYARAGTLYEEGLALFREIDDKKGIAHVLSQLAQALFLSQGDQARVRSLLEECLALSRELGFKEGIAAARYLFGQLALGQGDLAVAHAEVEESVVLYKQMGHRHGTAESLAALGKVVAAQGDYPAARRLYEESLTISGELGEKWVIAMGLVGLGEVVAAQRQLAWAAQLWGAADTLRDAIGVPIPPVELADYERTLSATRVHLGERAFAAAWSQGRAMTPGLALAAQGQKPAAPPAATTTLPTYPAGLTAREVEVLRLLADGLPDLRIAKKLVLSPRTVHAHISSIYSKLGITSRSAATRYAIEHHLA